MTSKGRRHRKIKVSVVIPAYNEEGNIEPLMQEFDRVLRSCSFTYELILVNDGSTDRTEQKMVEALKRYGNIRIVKNRVRMGLTRALSKGFDHTRGEILVFYPADLQFHPRDIPKMIDAIDNGADMVCGKKVGAYGKWVVSRIYNLMTRILFPKLKVSDMNSVKAFTRQVYDDFPTLREGWHRYLAAFAAAKDYIVREVPVTLERRNWGKSKFSGTSRIIKGLTDLIAVKFQVSVLGDPMHLFGKVSIFFFLIGLIIAGVAFYYRFVMGQGYRPLLYAVILCELSALVTFVMGIITEALVYLRDTLTDLKNQNSKLTEEIEHLSVNVQRGMNLARRRSGDEEDSESAGGESSSRSGRRSGGRQPRQRRSSDNTQGRSGSGGGSGPRSSNRGGRRGGRDRNSDRSSDRSNDRSNDRSGDRGGDRGGDRSSDRNIDRGNARDSERAAERGGDRNDRSAEPGDDRSRERSEQRNPERSSEALQGSGQPQNQGAQPERNHEIKLRELPVSSEQESKS